METLDSFEIALFADEGEGGFHIKNNPRQPFQRTTIHEERGAVKVKCTLADVVHGKWSPEDEYYASLIVFAFRFDPGKNGRRIKSARINVIFYGATEDDDPPAVEEISLNGSYNLLPSEQTETITSGIEGSASASILNAGNLSLNKSYEKVISRQVSDATHVSGTTCVIDMDYDPPNAAEWTLRENAELKTGVPAELKAGVLLKRTNMEQFKCAVQIVSDVDRMTRIGRWLGSRPKDDPVLFNPSFKSTNRLMNYDKEALGNFQLSLVEDVTFTTTWEEAVKSSRNLGSEASSNVCYGEGQMD